MTLAYSSAILYIYCSVYGGVVCAEGFAGIPDGLLCGNVNKMAYIVNAVQKRSNTDFQVPLL